MKVVTHLFAAASLLVVGGCHATQAREATMHTTNAPQTRPNPNLQYRIDAFAVPAASRAEFESLMHRNLAFLEKLPGFMSHTVFEKTHGPTTFDIVTIAVWESREAIDAASAKVRAHYQEIGFDMPAVMTRLGVVASLGYYRASIER